MIILRKKETPLLIKSHRTAQKQTKRVDAPARPLLVIEETVVVWGAPLPDGTVLLGGLLEHGTRLGHYGGLLWRQRGDNGAWIALDCVLGLVAVWLADKRRHRLNRGLVWRRMLEAGGGEGGARLVGSGQRGARQGSSWRRCGWWGETAASEAGGGDHGDGYHRDGHRERVGRRGCRHRAAILASLLYPGDIVGGLRWLVFHIGGSALDQLLLTLLFLQFILCDQDKNMQNFWQRLFTHLLLSHLEKVQLLKNYFARRRTENCNWLAFCNKKNIVTPYKGRVHN